jgi:hypothetical protein
LVVVLDLGEGGIPDDYSTGGVYCHACGGINQGVGEGVGVVVYGGGAVGKYCSGVEFGIRRGGGDEDGIYINWRRDLTDAGDVNEFAPVNCDGECGCGGGGEGITIGYEGTDGVVTRFEVVEGVVVGCVD